MYCVEVSQGQSQYCIREPHRRICDLDPYDHLRRFYRLCITHFKRNILALRGQVSKNVYDAMLSLASAEAHPNIRTTLSIIRQGGKKARGKVYLKYHSEHLIICCRCSMAQRQGDFKVCIARNLPPNEFHTNRNMESITNDYKRE